MTPRRREPAHLTPAVEEALRTVVAEATAVHGEPRLGLVGPVLMVDDERGQTSRMSVVWFLPSPRGGLVNHGFRVEEKAPMAGSRQVWWIDAWNHGGPIAHVEMRFRQEPTAADIRNAIRYVGLLPPLVEVTKFGDPERVFLNGVDMSPYRAHLEDTSGQ